MRTSSGGFVINDQQPPVNEVVLSVAIAPQELLGGPRLSEVLGEWFSQYPDTQALPPYEMPSESPLPLQLPRLGGPRIEIVTSVPAVRYWLTSADRPYLLQTQPDYLALNWRRRDASSDYVHYQAIREQFAQLLSTVESNLKQRGAALVPSRAELTYVNVIEPNAVWTQASDVHKLFALDFPDSGNYEQISFAFTKAIRSSGDWVGRIRVSLEAGHDQLKDKARLLLSLTARTGTLHEPSVPAAIDFLDRAHESINATFLTLLTLEARELWGLSDHYR